MADPRPLVALLDARRVLQQLHRLAALLPEHEAEIEPVLAVIEQAIVAPPLPAHVAALLQRPGASAALLEGARSVSGSTGSRLAADRLAQIEHRAACVDPSAYHSVTLAQADRAALLAHVIALEAELDDLRTRLARAGIALAERAHLDR